VATSSLIRRQQSILHRPRPDQVQATSSTSPLAESPNSRGIGQSIGRRLVGGGGSGGSNVKASFVFMGSIPIGMDKYNKKTMIVTIRDLDLFRVEN
jgi:hypothetical protein